MSNQAKYIPTTKGRPKPADSFKELLEQWRQAGGNPNGPVREVYGWAADELEALLRKLGIEEL